MNNDTILEIKWKDGSRGKGDATACYAELERIRGLKGCLLPEDVVALASADNNPLHQEFTWDDSVAADKFRKEEARSLMRSIRVVYAEAPTIPTRAYHVTTQRVKPDEKPRAVYQSVKEILADPIAKDELLSRAIRDALAFRKAYHALSELAQVFKAMDQFVESAEGFLGE
jgi:hypothetical protein